ncbi:hypothetical protein N9555_00555 [Flavobacteriaceae bacterium]|jgi:hypothetical protein|nr:hypothetical protein [Flavobacteriaceae bacterium]MDA7765088.1 hypothetical protein [Flavobacteriaceae bacterium]MDA7820374.1 hypothetical protein [Flavobacteriaceae bacterium]MDA9157708.1 hypothetical protein [Flavobacteriaceae bacterium]MDA9832942.1 hypothetical protein [Flavobacteriaceae bacterium]|tara:strand:+ start:704 stop:997 length:294 start_codon:yes stop_codon:yes gene_type:complete
MKSLNENWFAFTLVAVIFGILGFLLGKQGGHSKCPMMDFPHAIQMDEFGGMKKGGNMFMFKSDRMMNGKDGFEIDIDTIHSGGEKQIKVRVITDKEE